MVLGDENGGDQVYAVEVGLGVFPRYPREDLLADSLVQKYVETEWEGNSELDAREAHEAEVEVAIVFEVRVGAVDEFVGHDLALY